MSPCFPSSPAITSLRIAANTDFNQPGMAYAPAASPSASFFAFLPFNSFSSGKRVT